MAVTETSLSSLSCEPGLRTEERIQVGLLDRSKEAAWERYAIEHADGTFFHQLGWKRVIERTYGFKPYYFYAERDGNLTGIAPAFLISSWVGGRCLLSLPFAVYGGICASDPSSELSLIRKLEAVATELNVDYLELRNRTCDLEGYQQNLRYSTFSLPIGRDIDAVHKAFPKDIRYMIRKGEKAGLHARSGLDQLGRFYDLLTVNLRRLGTPAFPKSLFQNLIQEYPQQVDITVVYAGDRAIAAGMSFFYKDCMQPYYIGSLDEAKSVAGNDYLWWELIKLACKRGCTTFDFGRSKNESGNFAFKKKWNPTIEGLRYQVQLYRAKSLPNNSPTNGKFKAALAIWKVMPLSITRAIGPSIVRWFP